MSDNKHVRNLRRTRADMLGTDDEDHYWECHAAATEIEKLEDEIERLTDELINVELVAKDRYCTMQTQIERLQDQLSFMTKECKRFEAVVDAAKHLLAGGDKEAVYHLYQALDALEDDADRQCPTPTECYLNAGCIHGCADSRRD